MASRNLTSQGRVFLAAAMLLLLGLALDLGVNQPRQREIGRLRAQRASMLVNLAGIQQHDLDLAAAAQRLGIRDPERGFVFDSSVDPVAFLNDVVARAGLTTVELSTEASVAQGRARRTVFTLVVRGGFGRIFDLIRTLEQGPRLTTIDGFTVMQPYEGTSLEGRLKLSIYDPLQGGGQ